jgi:hypothetical protein
MLGLRIPIRLKDDFRQAAAAVRVTAALHGKPGYQKKKGVEKTLAHIGGTVPESAGQDNMGHFASSGLIVSMQNLNMVRPAAFCVAVIN